MRSLPLLAALLATLLWTGAPLRAEEAGVPGLSPDQLKVLQPVVDNAVAAYNKGDWKAFYKDFAKQVESMCTQQCFDSLYTNMAKKQHGSVKSKKLNKSRSTFSDMNGLLVYDATFDKDSGVVAVNFFKENGVWKIQQFQLTK